MWNNPVPAETVVGAIVGAVLSTILAQNDYFKIANWVDTRYGIMFTALILVFGVCAHFHCAAISLSKYRLSTYFLFVCIFASLVVLLINAQELKFGQNGQIIYRPRWTNVMLVGIFGIWFGTLRALTSAKMRFDR